eukprot:jgi/Astpho2/8806/fgenesh1_pg.00129_%23_8_t
MSVIQQQLLVTGVGQLLGAVIRGVAGMGSSLGVIAVYTAARAIKVHTGSFETLVLADTVASLVAAPVFMYATHAGRFCDWRLVLTVFVFQAVGCPLGGWMLEHLTNAKLQLALAGALTVVLAAEQAGYTCLPHLDMQSASSTDEDIEADHRVHGAAALLPCVSPSAAAVPAQPESALEEMGHVERRADSSLLAFPAQLARSPPAPSPFVPPALGSLGAATTQACHAVSMHGPSRPAPSTRSPAPLQRSVSLPIPGQPAPVAGAMIVQVNLSHLLEAGEELRLCESGGSLHGGVPRGAASATGAAEEGRSLVLTPEGSFRFSIAKPPLTDTGSSGPLMFHVSTAVLHRLQERARPVSVLYGAAALWGYLQSDRQTVVFVCPVSSEWGPTTTSQPTLAPWEVHHPESLPVAFTSRPHLDPELAHSAAPGTAVEAEGLTAAPGSSAAMRWTDDLQASDLPLPASALRQVAAGDAGMAGGAGSGKQALAGAKEAGHRITPTMAAYKVAEKEKWRGLKIAAAGSLTGIASGVLGVFSGLTGPPLILKYEMLNVPKEVVRATNAVMLIVSPRVFWYIKMGAFDKRDMPAYAVSSVAALVGLFVGHRIACSVHQRTFNHLLIGMLVASTVMLFVGGSIGLESELHGHAAAAGGG